MPLSVDIQPLVWADGLEVLPVQHGSAVFSMALRQLLWNRRYQALAFAFPQGWEALVADGIAALPEVHAAVFSQSGKPTCYLPFDPCDAYVEGWRQAQQRKIPWFALEDDTRLDHRRDILLPDAQLLPAFGAEGYHALAVKGFTQEWSSEENKEPWAHLAQVVAQNLKRLQSRFGRILFLCDYPLLPLVENIFRIPEKEYVGNQVSEAADPSIGIREAELHVVKSEHLYFALGEPPFFAAEVEKERQNPLTEPKPYFELVKTLFLRTREQFLELAVERRAVTVKGVQQALTYARNLAALQGSLSPSLFDLIIAAKGVLGSGFAQKLLTAARFYPFITPEADPGLEIGLDKIQIPGEAVSDAFNLLEDHPKTWRPLRLKPEPDQRQQKSYRYGWDNRGLCSHLPEDVRIERFNRVVRTRAQERDLMAHSRIEKLTSSLKDGIDMRETLRHWHTRTIYVREAPPQTKRVDTVILIFDDKHDSRYTQRVTWYAEHENESTLTFYATDPMDHLIGPGVSQSEYGGLSLLYPPRQVPDVFGLPAGEMGFQNLAEQLVYGALRHSGEKSLAYVAEYPPSLRLRLLARSFKKRLVHIPLGSFSTGTLRRLRRFHMLNGKHVRSWASRYIQD